jgi:acetyltransferase-like isoleucine patch superfamily enzyme
MEKITIGENCLFGENVKIYDHNHRFKSTSLIKDQGYTTAPITIGRNVWVGSDVTILKGVTVGDNSVIGAGCVISENIPANHVVSRQPALSIEPISN